MSGKRTKAKAAAKPDQDAAAPETTITSIKGFDRHFQCRGFQFEVGKIYEHSGKIAVCESGFHACEYPLDVFDYYPPASSRYAVVIQSGTHAFHDSDSKVCSAKIKVEVEIGLSALIERAVKWVFDRAKPEGNGSSATGDRGAASATGTSGAAMASGRYGRAQGADGCALFLVYRDDNWNIKHAWGGIVGKNGIKPLTWYSLDERGEPVECK